jgi:hypothetical protein
LHHPLIPLVLHHPLVSLTLHRTVGVASSRETRKAGYNPFLYLHQARKIYSASLSQESKSLENCASPDNQE